MKVRTRIETTVLSAGGQELVTVSQTTETDHGDNPRFYSDASESNLNSAHANQRAAVRGAVKGLYPS